MGFQAGYMVLPFLRTPDRQIKDKSLDSQTWSVRQRKSPSFVSGPADVCSSSSLNPPISLSSLVFRWFKVHVEVRVTPPLFPVTPNPLRVSEQQTPSGIDLFPLQTKHTYTHVAFMCSAGVATHCQAYKCSANAQTH